MPRLIGKQSSSKVPLSLLIVAAIASAIGMEYLGTINVINGFGSDSPMEIRTDPERPLN